MYGNEEYIEFDLMSLNFDEVRTVLEVGGFSVRRDRQRLTRIIACRTEPNLAPSVHEIDSVKVDQAVWPPNLLMVK